MASDCNSELVNFCVVANAVALGLQIDKLCDIFERFDICSTL